LIVERIETIDDFANLRNEWNSLLEASRSQCVFLTHEWLFTWWKHLAGTRTLSIFTARENGRLAGFLPLAMRRAQYSRMIPRSLEFIGSGLVGSDYLDAVAAPGCEQEVIKAFSSHLSRAGMVLHLTAIRRGASVVADLASHLGRSGWSVSDSAINICPYLDLRGQTWETYLSMLGSSQRYNFNRRLKNLKNNFDLRLDIEQTATSAQAALDIVIDLHRKRWASKPQSEAFQDAQTVAFHREFVDLAAAQGWLRLLVIRIDGVPAAALYGLRYGDVFYFYQSGFDPAWSRQSVGLVTMGLAIRSAIEEGVAEYDFLHGTEEYKYHWAPLTRELGRLELYPHHSRGQLSRRAVDFNRAVRKVAKRMLGKAA
jgi:CelD/BcsL family acetyltransferase involved in cellulose biosynthesis